MVKNIPSKARGWELRPHVPRAAKPAYLNPRARRRWGLPQPRAPTAQPRVDAAK